MAGMTFLAAASVKAEIEGTTGVFPSHGGGVLLTLDDRRNIRVALTDQLNVRL
jgi:hypothetical protein